MNIVDKILELSFIEDVTETSWWTAVVFQQLEQGSSDERGADLGLAASPSIDDV
jgi:hypothetical protein